MTPDEAVAGLLRIAADLGLPAPHLDNALSYAVLRRARGIMLGDVTAADATLWAALIGAEPTTIANVGEEPPAAHPGQPFLALGRFGGHTIILDGTYANTPTDTITPTEDR